MNKARILDHLKKHGQLLDSEIAAAMGVSVPKVRATLVDLSAQGAISCCRVTRFNEHKPVEEVLCRISGYLPPASPGRKPGR